MAAIIIVLELFYKLSFKTKVSLLSLKGINLPPLELLEFSAKALITDPKTVRDLLIFLASFSLSPEALVLFYLSEPARSTKFNFDFLST